MSNETLKKFGFENPVKIIPVEIKETNPLTKDNLDKYATLYFTKHYWVELENKIKSSALYFSFKGKKNKDSLLDMFYKMYVESFKLGLVCNIDYCNFAEEYLKKEGVNNGKN